MGKYIPSQNCLLKYCGDDAKNNTNFNKQKKKIRNKKLKKIKTKIKF